MRARNTGQYRKVSRYVWRDPRFRHAGNDAQLAFLYLWTGPEGNASGVLATSAQRLALALEWPPDRAEAALEALEVAGLADVDLAAEVVALNILDFETPDSSKVVAHWAACLADLPPSPAITKALEHLRAHCVSRGANFAEAFAKMVASLPPRFSAQGYTVSHTVCHTVSHTQPIPKMQKRATETETETETDPDPETPTPTYPPPDPDPDPERARGNGSDPEPIGAIAERLLKGVAHG